MRYTQKYLEENYSQEEINEVTGLIVRGLAKGGKGIAKGVAKILGLGAGGAAFGLASSAGEQLGDASMDAAKKAGELALDPDQDRSAAAGFGGRADITSEKGRRLSRKVGGAVSGFPGRRTSDIDRSLANIVKRTEKAKEGAKSSDLEAGFKEKRKKK